MASPTQTQVDTIQQSTTNTKQVNDIDTGGEIRKCSFSKSFLVNFSNNMGYSGFKLGAANTDISELDEGFHQVPYWLPWASIQITEWNTMIRQANRIRCVHMGFKMEEIQTSRIETKSEAGTTVLTATVAPEGKIHVYKDDEHWTDELMTNTDGQDIWEHNNTYRSPVCVGSAVSATLPRVKIIFPPDCTAAFRAISTTIPAYQGPSLYHDQGVQHLPSTSVIEHSWNGTEPWRPSGSPYVTDSDWDEKGIPNSKPGEVKNLPEVPRSNRPMNDGTLTSESTRVGWFRSNVATGINVAPHHRPETVLVKVEPAQNVGIGDVKMNAKAWITYTSTWEYTVRKMRMLQMDVAQPYNVAATALNADWWRQSQWPSISFIDRSTIFLDTMQRYTRRQGTNRQPPILYGPSGQLPPRAYEG